jgi:hypothetical protein
LPEKEWAVPFSLVIDDKDDDQGDLVIEQVRHFIGQIEFIHMDRWKFLGRNRSCQFGYIIEEDAIVSHRRNHKT